MENSEISENHLKAIVGGRQVAEMNWVGRWTGKVAEKPQSEGKASESGFRCWYSLPVSADYMDLQERAAAGRGSPSYPELFDRIS